MSIHLGSGIKKGRKWDIGKIVKEGFFKDSSFLYGKEVKNVHGKNFTYNGKSSEDYKLMIASFEQDEEIQMGLSRDILSGEMNMYRTSPNHMGTKYNSVLSFTITIIKDPCDNTTTGYFTEDEVDDVNAWLTSANYPLLFHMYDYDPDVYKKYDYFGIFTESEAQVVNGKVVGIKYTFTTNSPYAFTELITKKFYCVGETTLTINISNSEREGWIYPVIKLEPTNTSELSRVDIGIKSITDNNREMTVNVLKEPFVIDCQKSKIYDSLGLLSFDDLGISDIDYIYWLKLYHGENNLVVTGDTAITFEYREPRKVGAY